ncbi:ABC transporter permease subunit [Aneurinibacillus sp. Ricciae_BoGa-3]|uniref:ABC transporter permease n=1 Tax=Aneurinibacillus sp. Ricciae_BoGa-3 TaxID=3022697 RepID=UPI0023419CB8|nr:ABC transporter permease subunit [Aneurinibacillus sp. Ricciae_BoGa-3]WCK54323.1 ABC transporter permease subunit [Aneurinibacillus sp. Ricciae_BoGa-3]
MQFIGKSLMYLLIVLVSVFMILPLFITILGSVSVYWGSAMFSSGWTLQWYREVFNEYGQTIIFTLTITLLAVILNVLLGTMTGYLFSKSTHPAVKVLEEILTLPIAVPGVAIALALIQTYAWMRVSGALILVGHVVVTFPLMFRTVLGTLRTKDFRLLDDCAASLGAGPFYRFFHVILPSIKSAVLSGAIMVFMLSLGEFNMTFFLYTPLKRTLTVGLYEAYSSLRIEVGSAFTVVFLLLAIPLMYFLHRSNQSTTFSRNGGV